MGIKELDVLFIKIYEKLKDTDDIKTISLLEDLLKHETQYIFDIFFNEVPQSEKIKYQSIIELSQ